MPFEAYAQNDEARNRLIQDRARRTTVNKKTRSNYLGQDAIRNLKNNISYLLRKAVELGIIQSQQDFFNSKRCPTRFISTMRRREHIFNEKYTIDPIPAQLQAEIPEYRVWSTKIVNRGRPGKLRKRELTFDGHCRVILRFAGYLVKFAGFDRESINLSTLIQGNNTFEYIEWYVQRQGRFTRGALQSLSVITSLAKYLSITAQRAERADLRRVIEELLRYRSELDPAVTVIDKASGG
jgi:hypothetical protein